MLKINSLIIKDEQVEKYILEKQEQLKNEHNLKETTIRKIKKYPISKVIEEIVKEVM